VINNEPCLDILFVIIYFDYKQANIIVGSYFFWGGASLSEEILFSFSIKLGKNMCACFFWGGVFFSIELAKKGRKKRKEQTKKKNDIRQTTDK